MTALTTTTTTVPATARSRTVAVLAPNTRRAYGSAWSGWERSAADGASVAELQHARGVEVAHHPRALHPPRSGLTQAYRAAPVQGGRVGGVSRR